jgi:hypothetical protein
MFNNKKIKMKKNRSLLFLAVFCLVFGPLAGAQASQATKKTVLDMTKQHPPQAPKENPGGDGGQQDAMGNPSSIQILDMEKMPVQQAQEENTPSSDDDDAKSTGSKWSTLAQDNLKVSPTQDFPSIQPVPQAQEESKGPASLEIVVKQPQQRETKPQEEDENYRKAGLQEEEKHSDLSFNPSNYGDDTCSMMSGGVANNSANSPRSALAQNGSIASPKNRAPVLKDEARIEPRIEKGELYNFRLVRKIDGQIYCATKYSVLTPGEKYLDFSFETNSFMVKPSSPNDTAKERLQANPEWRRGQALIRHLEKVNNKVLEVFDQEIDISLLAPILQIYQNSKNKNELSDILPLLGSLNLDPEDQKDHIRKYLLLFMNLNSETRRGKEKKRDELYIKLYLKFDEEAVELQRIKYGLPSEDPIIENFLNCAIVRFGVYALVSRLHQILYGGSGKEEISFLKKVRKWPKNQERTNDLKDPAFLDSMKPALKILGMLVMSALEAGGSPKRILLLKQYLSAIDPNDHVTHKMATILLAHAEFLKKCIAEMMPSLKKLRDDCHVSQDHIFQLIGSAVLISTDFKQYFFKGVYQTSSRHLREYEQFIAEEQVPSNLLSTIAQQTMNGPRNDGYYAHMHFLKQILKEEVLDENHPCFVLDFLVKRAYLDGLVLLLEPNCKDVKRGLISNKDLCKDGFIDLLIPYVLNELDQMTQSVFVDDTASSAGNPISIIDDEGRDLNKLNQSGRFSIISDEKSDGFSLVGEEGRDLNKLNQIGRFSIIFDDKSDGFSLVGEDEAQNLNDLKKGLDQRDQDSSVSDIDIENSDTVSIIEDEAQNLNDLKKGSDQRDQDSSVSDIDIENSDTVSIIESESAIFDPSKDTENVMKEAAIRFIRMSQKDFLF